MKIPWIDKSLKISPFISENFDMCDTFRSRGPELMCIFYKSSEKDHI